jgi:uncharacterized repeat protein (TIGR03803 family)
MPAEFMSVESRFALMNLDSGVGGALTLALVFALLLITLQPAQAQTESVLYSFCSESGCSDGSGSYAGLVTDKKGDLYGTTYFGGANNYGTVFKLTPAGNESVLYSFCSQSGCSDGSRPQAGVILDKKGNLYGTTSSGGAHGLGAVFRVTPAGSESVLYSFCSQSGCSDGHYPLAGLLMDTAGNLYGTTYLGGADNGGTVFKLTRAGNETVLYSFPGGSDGSGPNAGLIVDKLGNLYGTTVYGGVNYGGTVFKLTPAGEETVLHSFCSQSGCSDGSSPMAGLIMDTAGNLYGTTYYGGDDDDGTVFELTPAGVETVLYSFTYGYIDGGYPYAGLVVDKKGNLYGASSKGPYPDDGAVFEVSSPSKKGGSWSFTSLHAFENGTGDGNTPLGTLILDEKGAIYGTTLGGGANGDGTVFEVTP